MIRKLDKIAEYQALACVRQVVLLAQAQPIARVWTREGAGCRAATAEGLEAALDLSAVGVTLPLAEIYEDIEFDPIDEEA